MYAGRYRSVAEVIGMILNPAWTVEETQWALHDTRDELVELIGECKHDLWIDIVLYHLIDKIDFYPADGRSTIQDLEAVESELLMLRLSE
jgi:hypothetical protein